MENSIDNGTNLDTYDQFMKLVIIAVITLPLFAAAWTIKKCWSKARRSKFRKFFRK